MKLDDHPKEQLLNTIAGYVKYSGLKSIALDVGMDEARFSHIQYDFREQAKDQVFEVCLCGFLYFFLMFLLLRSALISK